MGRLLRLLEKDIWPMKDITKSSLHPVGRILRRWRFSSDSRNSIPVKTKTSFDLWFRFNKDWWADLQMGIVESTKIDKIGVHRFDHSLHIKPLQEIEMTEPTPTASDSCPSSAEQSARCAGIFPSLFVESCERDPRMRLSDLLVSIWNGPAKEPTGHPFHSPYLIVHIVLLGHASYSIWPPKSRPGPKSANKKFSDLVHWSLLLRKLSVIEPLML